MQLRRLTWLMLLCGLVGCGSSFPVSLPRLGGVWRTNASPAAGGTPQQYNQPAFAQQPSWWQKPLAWVGLGNSQTDTGMQYAPNSIPPDDPLSLQNTPENIGPEIYVKAAQLYEFNGNLDRAAAQYELALKVAPEDPAVLVAYARLLDRQNKFEEAIAKYSSAGRLQPENASIRNDVGLCLARQGQLDVALRELDYAVRLRPQETLFRNNIAKVLVEVGRPDAALEHMLAVHPPAVAHYNVGFMLYELQQAPLAAQQFQQALQIDPTFVKAHRMLQLMTPAPPRVAAQPAATQASYYGEFRSLPPVQ